MVERRTVKCANCGRVVDARRPHRKYCTPECRMAAWWVRKRIAEAFGVKPSTLVMVTELPEPRLTAEELAARTALAESESASK
jgi:hypothetical protein